MMVKSFVNYYLYLNFSFEMDSKNEAVKSKIHEYIDQADERFLNLVYGMIQADQSEVNYILSEDELRVVEERLEEYTRNPNSGAEWSEVKKRLS
jgi:hypothetical protein